MDQCSTIQQAMKIAIQQGKMPNSVKNELTYDDRMTHPWYPMALTHYDVVNQSGGDIDQA